MRHPQPDIEDILKSAAHNQEIPVASAAEKDASWNQLRDMLDALPGSGPADGTPPDGGGSPAPAGMPGAAPFTGAGMGLIGGGVAVVGVTLMFTWYQFTKAPADALQDHKTKVQSVNESTHIKKDSMSAATLVTNGDSVTKVAGFDSASDFSISRQAPLPFTIRTRQIPAQHLEPTTRPVFPVLKLSQQHQII